MRLALAFSSWCLFEPEVVFIRAEVVFILARGGVYSTELVTISPIGLPFMRLTLAFSSWLLFHQAGYYL